MSAKVTFKGLAELRAALRKLPSDLATSAANVVNHAADDSAKEIIAAYSQVTGDLKSKVKVVPVDAGRFGVTRVVRSTSQHARLYEEGSQTRQTAIGANRGAMPAANKFVPIVARHRDDMVDELIDIVKAAGLEVKGG